VVGRKTSANLSDCAARKEVRECGDYRSPANQAKELNQRPAQSNADCLQAWAQTFCRLVLGITVTHIKQQLEQLRLQAVKLIKDPSLDDPTALARLAPIPAKLQQLEGQIEEIEDEKSRIEQILQSFSHTSDRPITEIVRQLGSQALSNGNGRREQKKIRIEIDLSQLGLSGGKKVICEHKASDSLIRFLSLLYETKGVTVLEKLLKFSVNRGVLVSKRPESDYRYRSGGGEAEYQYQRISDSGYFALTQSATKEKVSDIRRACQFLNFPSSALKVEEADKYEPLA